MARYNRDLDDVLGELEDIVFLLNEENNTLNTKVVTGDKDIDKRYVNDTIWTAIQKVIKEAKSLAEELVETITEKDDEIDDLKIDKQILEDQVEEEFFTGKTITISDAKIHGVRPTESITGLIATTLSEEMELEDIINKLKR